MNNDADLLITAIFCIIISSGVALGTGAVDAALNPKTHDWKLGEYALIFILAAVILFAVLMFGSNIGEPWSTINDSLNGV